MTNAATKTTASINLNGYRSMNINRSDAYQSDLGWAILTGAHTVAELAQATQSKPGKVTYHLKKMAAKGAIVLTKEHNADGRLLLVARHAKAETIPAPEAQVLPQEKTVDAKFERIVRTSGNNPGRLSRACDLVARLGKRTADGGLMSIASALNEQRHIALQAKLADSARQSGNEAARIKAVNEMAYHVQNRDRHLASARRYVERHPNNRHLRAA